MPYEPKTRIVHNPDPHDGRSLIIIDRTRRLHESLHLATYVVGRPTFDIMDGSDHLFSQVNSLGVELSLLDGVTMATISQYRVHLKVAALFVPQHVAKQAETYIDAFLNGIHLSEESASV